MPATAAQIQIPPFSNLCLVKVAGSIINFTAISPADFSPMILIFTERRAVDASLALMVVSLGGAAARVTYSDDLESSELVIVTTGSTFIVEPPTVIIIRDVSLA